MAKEDFKDSKFGKFLNKAKEVVLDKGDDLALAALQVATGKPAQGIQTVMKALGASSIPESDVLLKELEVERDIYLAELKDLQNARELQVAALGQEDDFSKRYVYYFASALFLFSASIVIMLFFVEIPEQNQRIVDMILGVIIGTGLVSVINFFFGSSKGSKDKDRQLDAKSIK